MKTFKVDIRTTCKVCGEPIRHARYRTYCSAKCRNSYNNKKRQPLATAWQRAKRDRIASVPDENKCQCLFCGKWYVQVCSHAYLVHGVTGRQYREHFELEVKRGFVPDWYRKLKGDITMDNDTFENLKHGAYYQFKNGDKNIGKYKRSPVTIERLKNLHKLNKRCGMEKEK